MPGYPSVPRRVDSSLTVGFSGRGIGADTRSIHNRMGFFFVNTEEQTDVMEHHIS